MATKGAIGARAAADIERAADLIRQAMKLLDGIPEPYLLRVEAIKGTEFLEARMVRELWGLSEDIQTEVDRMPV